MVEQFYDVYVWGRDGIVTETNAKELKAQLVIVQMYSVNCVIPGPDEGFVRVWLEQEFQDMHALGVAQ